MEFYVIKTTRKYNHFSSQKRAKKFKKKNGFRYVQLDENSLNFFFVCFSL